MTLRFPGAVIVVLCVSAVLLCGACAGPSTPAVKGQVVTRSEGNVSISVSTWPEEGWMADGYGNVNFTLANKSSAEAKFTKWRGHWEVAGVKLSDEWNNDVNLVVPAGQKKATYQTGWLPPKVAAAAGDAPGKMLSVCVVKVGGKEIEFHVTLLVRATKLPQPTKLEKGRNVGLDLMESHFKGLKNLPRTLSYMDNAYEAMADLAGFKPFGGKMIVFKESPRHFAFAYAGNPIILNRSFVEKNLHEFDRGEISFGWVHEMGHDFDTEIGDGYIWDVQSQEFQGNFKLSCALDTVAVPKLLIARWDKNPAIKEKLVDGKRFNDLYYLPAGDEYLADSKRTWNTMTANEIQSLYLRLARQYGWGIFKEYYRTYHKLKQAGAKAPKTGEDKVRLAVAILSRTTGGDMVKVFAQWRFPVTEANVAAIAKQYSLDKVMGTRK